MLRTLAPPLTRPARAARSRRLAALGTALLTLLGGITFRIDRPERESPCP
ncbi:hypothetical protein ACH4T9_17035 [Micromonospora sp. NPDC020750]